MDLDDMAIKNYFELGSPSPTPLQPGKLHGFSGIFWIHHNLAKKHP